MAAFQDVRAGDSSVARQTRSSSDEKQSPPSRPSSTRSRPLSIVPRSQQRGLLGRFTVIPELGCPYEYTKRTKWAITAVVALAGGLGPLGSGIFYPALPQISLEFDTEPVIANLSVALYMLAMGIFPLWWSSFSETLGRRNIYLVSFSLFIVFSVLSAVSHSIAMLVVMRLLSGGASASVQAVGAGTIADIWESRERGRAMSIFYLGPLIGPLLGPIAGGALSEALGWQSTMWALTIYGGVILLLLVFCLPETLPRLKSPPAPTVVATANDSSENNAGGLTRTKTAESVKESTKRAAVVFKQLIVDPLSILLYLRFPPVAITVYYAAITFGTLFALNISVQAAYSTDPYGFSPSILGLMYIPSGTGYIIASLLGGRWLDYIMAREARKAGRYDDGGNLVLLPEDRMRENAWLAATVYPASLIFYGWTIQNGVFWFVPVISQFTFGGASMLVFAAATTMLTEFMPKRSSSGVAVNNFVRNMFSCTGAVAAQPVISSIGHGWLFTILGVFTWVTGYACIWALKKKAPVWRISMEKELNR
ncbi:MFS general substrate transporter [Sodiomyces alkalinus F11]|uniref:MFS general substrate transporter n=1 Tax=Sodiomyces alkalinus (strain CBS 110278 / VKM F-3762 / F11) TaxID=1314773 RepID=A0A3N2PJH0_SODAK|nr:MFS general substrate transporter [Sodiomyces alkalinus F11]ROT34659.1 MFS general substrate transporter [Sodiomyces alkalinus F11]